MPYEEKVASIERPLLAEVLPEDVERIADLIWKELEPFKAAVAKAGAGHRSLAELSEERIPTLSLFPKHILTCGLEMAKIEGIVATESRDELHKFIDQYAREELRQIQEFLSSPEIREGIQIASSRLEASFAESGSNKTDKDTKVLHAGRMTRLIMNAKTFDYRFIPMRVTELGQHFPQHNVTYVYHDEQATPDAMISTHIHEKTHAYGDSSNTMDGENEIKTNGFATIGQAQGEPESGQNEQYVGFNEGFTEYTARKACRGIVNYGTLPNGGAYPDEVVMVQNTITRLVEVTTKSEDEIEKELRSIYGTSGGTARLREYLTAHGIDIIPS